MNDKDAARLFAGWLMDVCIRYEPEWGRASAYVCSCCDGQHGTDPQAIQHADHCVVTQARSYLISVDSETKSPPPTW